ncbi:MAG: hypothetical protein R2710_01430 [Acidimicrobiales bacterium]
MANTVRRLESDDVAAVEALLAAKRRQLAEWSPQFWRTAAGAVEVHELFLQWLLSDDANVGLTTADVDGVLIATPRDGAWLIDDFAVSGPGAWSTVGRALLEHAREQLGAGISVVCASRDVEQRALLDTCALVPYEEWWVADPALVATFASPAAASGDLPVASIVPAPPVYDPGGPVALVSTWDGERDSLAAYARAVDGECALVVVPVGFDDERRRAAVEDLGFTVASVWYR